MSSPLSRISSSASSAGRSILARWLRIAVGVGVGVCALILAMAADRDPRPIDAHYDVQIANPRDGIVHVRLSISGHRAGRIHLGFSSHAVARNAPVSKFRVRRAVDAAGKQLAIEHEPGLWSLGRSSRQLTVDYDVHLERPSDSEYGSEVLSRLDAEGGRLLGSDIFLFPVGENLDSLGVDFEMPTGWALHHPFQVSEFAARPPSLRSLYNSAMAVGPYRTTRRQVGGIDVELAIQGSYRFGDDDLMRVICSLVEQQVQRFGPPRRSRYVFVVNEHPDHRDPKLLHYFGLHFDGSMVVLLDPRTDRNRLRHEPASLCAHEFFHNWLGELVRQKSYAMNWFVEGVTTWYAYQSLIATRMLDSGSFADEVQERYRRIGPTLASTDRISVAQAGQRVLQDSRTTELLYSGGLFVAIALDEAVIEATAGEANLKTVLELLFRRARSDPGWRFTRAELERALSDVTHRSFTRWLDTYAYGHRPVKLPDFVTDAR